MSPSLRRGRTIVVTIIAVQMLLGIIATVLAVAAKGPDQLLPQGVKLAGNVALAYGLWKGSRWIKWFYVVGLALTALFLIFLAVVLQRPALALVLVTLAAASACGGAALGFSPAVQEFLAHQRGEPPPPAEEIELLDEAPAGLCACGQTLIPGIAFCSRCGRPAC